MKRKFLVIFTLIISFFFLFGLNKALFADEREELDQIEAEREEDFLKQLELDIPKITDNPSHLITFVDPSDTSEGVQLEIDEKGFELIRSPYSLPALRIGIHTLTFKFVDSLGSTQIVEKEIIVIPRPPIINSPSFGEDSMIISGTGLADSQLILILSSSKNLDTFETEINKEGTWNIEIDLTALPEGLYTFSAYTRRNGYASDLAESVTFEQGNSQNHTLFQGNKENDIYFSFGAITLDNIKQIILSNSDLLLLILITFTLGFLLSWVLNVILRNSTEKKVIEELEEKMNNNGKKEKEEKGMTLKEKLSKKGKKVEEEKEDKEVEVKEEEKKKEKKAKKEEKIVTKIDFLKDFKTFDPDDEKGREKEKIDIEITSKK
ncbi:MAG: hypothetical protein PHP96_02735 [Candidatus Dojkabacteria bacterium]|nr:hypothetical protein [Candidatus Dojkabacteria bacterium]NLB12237.1 hypothetical protein [Candidatus Dojkabacteria bacterium]